MKYLNVLVIILLIGGTLDAQLIKYSVGISSGFDFLSQKNKVLDDLDLQMESKAQISYNLNNDICFRINDFFGIRTGIVLSLKKINRKYNDNFGNLIENITITGYTVPQIRSVSGEDYGSVFHNDWWVNPDGSITYIEEDDQLQIVFDPVYVDNYVNFFDNEKTSDGLDYNLFNLSLPLQMQFSLFKQKLIISPGTSLSIILKEKNEEFIINEHFKYVNEFENFYLNMIIDIDYELFKNIILGVSYLRSVTGLGIEKNISPTDYNTVNINSNDRLRLNSFSLGLSYKF